MADIPPVHASAMQAGFQSRESTKIRDARRNEQTQSASQQLKSITDAAGMVDTADAGNQVFVDSEGAGSQGRAFGEPTDAPSETDDSSELVGDGITRDVQGRLHLDLDA